MTIARSQWEKNFSFYCHMVQHFNYEYEIVWSDDEGDHAVMLVSYKYYDLLNRLVEKAEQLKSLS